MERKNMKLRGLIYSKYLNESDFARNLGWSKQQLNRITTGRKLPDLMEVKTLANALNVTIQDLFDIFLP